MFYSGYTAPTTYSGYDPSPSSMSSGVGLTHGQAGPAGTGPAPSGSAQDTSSSSLFSANELQALDGFFNWQLQPQNAQPAPASFATCSGPTAPPPPQSYSYYPTNGSVQASNIKSTGHRKPSVIWDPTDRIETSEDRDRRLQSQENDLASWLSQYNNGSQTAPGHRRSSAASAPPPQEPLYVQPRPLAMPQRQSFSGTSARPSVLEAPPTDAVQYHGYPVLQDTFRRPNLPAAHPNPAPAAPDAYPSVQPVRRKSQDMLAEAGPVASGSGHYESIGGAKRRRASRATEGTNGDTQNPQDSGFASIEGDQAVQPNGATIPTRGKGKGKASAASRKARSGQTQSSSSSGARRGKAKAKAAAVEDGDDAADGDFVPEAIAPPTVNGDGSSKSDSPVVATARSGSAQRSGSASKGEPSGPKIALTEEQKRANHIASEQKRRTAIRLAYDELCNVVPPLRAAVKEYEERLNRVHGTATDTVAGALTGGIEIGGERVDGRAGPKSEAVVLGKTVEYMRELLEEREELLERYSRYATSNADSKAAPWNRKWSSKVSQS